MCMGRVSKNSCLARWEGRSGLLEAEEKILKSREGGRQRPPARTQCREAASSESLEAACPCPGRTRAHGAAARHPPCFAFLQQLSQKEEREVLPSGASAGRLDYPRALAAGSDRVKRPSPAVDVRLTGK